jgi:predicted dehydrogenase
MQLDGIDRRDFFKTAVGSAAAMAALPDVAPGWTGCAGERSRVRPDRVAGPSREPPPARIRFAVVGINHPHIYSQVGAVLRGGGELVSVHAQEPDLLAEFTKRFPEAKVARSEGQILEDGSIQLVLSSIIPDQRVPLGIRVMQHGKDYMSDKPGITTLEQLAEVRRVQAQTKRIYSIMYSERHENRATVKAGELVKLLRCLVVEALARSGV